MSKSQIEYSAQGAAPAVQYISELQRLYETYSLIEFVPHAIELTEKYYSFLKGADKQKMLVDRLNDIVEIDKELINHLINISFYVARNKAFIKLVKKNCKCIYFCSSSGKVVSDELN